MSLERALEASQRVHGDITPTIGRAPHYGVRLMVFACPVYRAYESLRGSKPGQRWSLQNRPTESGLGLGSFTAPPAVEASLFSCANSVDRN